MSNVERYDCDQDGEQFETPVGSYVLFRDYERLEAQLAEARRALDGADRLTNAAWAQLVEAKALLRDLLVAMHQLAAYGDEETDGAVYLTVGEWEERVRAFTEKVSPQG